MLTEKHHAILFALLARQVVIHFGEANGVAGVLLATRRYGEQRGRRMALRAIRDGQPLSMAAYLRYGEWRSLTGEGKSTRLEQPPNLVSRVQACPWANAWIETGLMPYGRLYCQEIDRALVRGFNPELVIEVKQTLSNGGEACEFVFHQAFLESDAQQNNDWNVLPWEYHCAHLFWTVRETFLELWGEPGEALAQAALTEFASRFGYGYADAILKYRGEDFNQLPGA